MTVSGDDGGRYDTLQAAYRDAAAGDVIGLRPGAYSLRPDTRRTANASPVDYETFDTRGLRLVGSGKAPSRVVFETSADVLALPSWQLWGLAVDAGGAVVGPRDDTFRDCTVESSLMDPVDYGAGSLAVDGTGTTLTTSGLSPAPSAVVTYHGIPFDRVLHAVEDLGMDPTGDTPIDAALDSAVQTGTLIEFPPGTYRYESRASIEGVSRFGIRGTGSSRRDVQFVPAAGAATVLVGSGENWSGPGILMENFSLQQRMDETTAAGLSVRSPDGSVARNLEWLGVTPDDNAGLDFTFTYATTDIDGVNVAERIVHGVDAESVEIQYPEGAQTLRGGPAHVGELILRDAELRNANENATRYTSEGVLTVEGGVFANNQNTQLRFSAGNHPTKVSSARGARLLADDDSSSISACLQLDSSQVGDDGAVVENCTMEWYNEGGRAVIDLPEYGSHGSATFRNCVVRNEARETPTVWAQEADQAEGTALTFENCSFTGPGGGFVAENRPGSVIRDSCLDMPNASVEGFVTQNVSREACRLPADAGVPQPVITATKTSGLSVEFTAADSTSPAGDLRGYRWSLDGATHTGKTVSCTLPVAGTYRVTLDVIDGRGQRGRTSRELLVGYPQLLPSV